MNKASLNRFLKILITFVFVSYLVYGYSFGIIGLTLKNNGSGCYCHGSSSSNVTVIISGPDTIAAGGTGIYTLTITGGPLIRGGTDIAVQRGIIDTIMLSGLVKIGGELTHSSPKLSSGGNVSFQFLYTAPQTAGRDTLYGVGNSVNYDFSSSGDQWNFSPNKIIIVRDPVGVVNTSTAEKFNLSQNYPNPFNPITNIRFQMPNRAIVKLIVLDVLGIETAALVNKELNPGIHEISWDASDFPSGVYFYKLTAGDPSVDGQVYSEIKKMILIK